jgi:hypothetical protein
MERKRQEGERNVIPKKKVRRPFDVIGWGMGQDEKNATKKQEDE